MSVLTDEDLNRPANQNLKALLEGRQEPEHRKRGPNPTLPPSTFAGARFPNSVLKQVDELIGQKGSTRADVLRNLVEVGLRALEP